MKSTWEEHPEIDFELLSPEILDDPEFEDTEFIIGGRQRFHLGHIRVTEWQEAIRRDRNQLQRLLGKTIAVTPARDGKLAELYKEVDQKLKRPTKTKDNQANRKVLIFTAFADTARYIYAQLQIQLRKRGVHIALVCGDGGNSTSLGGLDFDNILTNFSPTSKQRAKQPNFPQNEEIDVLVATDCISEGQNLQDCDMLINYDIHWNPVRIIQRFGRIDRIGSRNPAVHLVNFWPMADLDQYLNVKHRVEARMALVDLSATQTDNLLEDEQLEELISKDLLFRNQQLKRFQNEILDLEDFDDNVTLTDFSLDEFRLDLLQFLESRRAELENANPGLYAVVPVRPDIPMAQPGAIFCLRHRKANSSMQVPKEKGSVGDINPLGHHYLIYVLDDGTVRLTFTRPKQALNLFRELSTGHASAIEKLCDLFDQRTSNGTTMQHYDELIEKALESIKNTFVRRAINSLLSGRDGKLPSVSETPGDLEDEYELLTWLVILGPSNYGEYEHSI